MNRRLHSLSLAVSLVAASSCFTGEDALGLPCNDKGDCGQDHACMAGYCATVDAGPCGDGRLNKGEECDDGNADDADACTSQCKLATCGDGILQVGVEACDDGDGNGPDQACSPACTINSCGDGVINGGDACDDGAGNGPDKACTPVCTVNVCGDGYPLASEGCDDGDGNGPDQACTPECTVNTCGDGYVGPGESCDSPDRSLCTDTCLEVLFFDRMEMGMGAWTHEVVNVSPAPCNSPDFCFDDLWQLTADVKSVDTHPDMAGTTRAWWTTNLAKVQGPASTRLISPEIDLTAAKAPIQVSFAHWYRFLQNPDKPAWNVDGAFIEVSVDGGPFEAIDMPGYTGVIADHGDCTFDNPLLGSPAFLDEVTAWSTESGSLDAFAGHTIRLGFHIATDCSISLPLHTIEGPFKSETIEWFIDNVRVVGDTAAR